MGTPTPRELALESEVQRLRERIALLERGKLDERQMGEAESIADSTLFRLSPISITISDLNDGDRFLEVNDAFEKFTGHTRESVIGKTYPPDWLWADAEEYAQAVAQFTSSGRLNGFEFRFRHTSGEIRNGQLWARSIDFAGKSCVLAMTIDITERKRAEAEGERLQRELAHSQKMQSVGRLAGGIAHDFNNLMSLILMHADSAIEELTEGHALESIKGVRYAAERGVAIGRQLMAFSSKQVLQTEILNLNSVIADSLRLVQRLIGEDVKVVFESGSGSSVVKADRGQLGQIVMNLAINSRDAMPEGGTFAIETATVELDESSAQLSPEAKPGAYVMLVVRDTGTGMDQETQARAFEPFFTTKGVGKGTGLGLAVVYGVVKQSGGFITATSEPGHGTEFKIYLPAVAEKLVPILDAGAGSIRGGWETILLVEDEPALRKKIDELLRIAGYQVLTASDGEQAYRLSLEHARPIHLLLTDVVMPGISGSRLSERLRGLHPETKVLFMSGYPDTGAAAIDLRSVPNFIAKPFTRDRLLRHVRDVLDKDSIAEAAT